MTIESIFGYSYSMTILKQIKLITNLNHKLWLSKNSTMYFLYYNPKVTKAFAFFFNFNESTNPINRFSVKKLKRETLRSKDKPKTIHEWWDSPLIKHCFVALSRFCQFYQTKHLILIVFILSILGLKGQSFMHLSKRVYTIMCYKNLSFCYFCNNKYLGTSSKISLSLLESFHINSNNCHCFKTKFL